jgi:pyruvate formate lyase activating enzyme
MPFQSEIVPARYWHALPEGRLQCDLCPRGCRLKDGQRGLCFVRMRQDEQIVLTTYGRSSGFCIDPIEKKPLYHFLPGTPVLSFGTAGCNLACQFCQNWDISKSDQTEVMTESASPEQLAKAATRCGCRSVAFTYNDPVIFLEYAVDTARLCLEAGVKTVAVTNGYICAEPRREFYSCMSAANVDLKAFSEAFYQNLCAGHLQHVLETLIYLKRETKVWFELTTLLIPEENDSPKEIEAMSEWVLNNLGADVPLHFSAFHPDYRMRDKPPTPPETVRMARRIAMEKGLHYVYTGNIRDPEGAATYCHKCGVKLVERDGYEITGYALGSGGTCRACGALCAGVFEAAPGDWGSKRMAVRINP